MAYECRLASRPASKPPRLIEAAPRRQQSVLLAVARCVANQGQPLNHTVAMRIPVIPAFQRYRLRHGQPGRVVGWSSSATVSTTALAPSTFPPTHPDRTGFCFISVALCATRGATRRPHHL